LGQSLPILPHPFNTCSLHRNRDGLLREANLVNANLSGANLSGADLHNADLRSADLDFANFFKADLSGVDLHRAKLDKTILAKEQIDQAKPSTNNDDESVLSDLYESVQHGQIQDPKIVREIASRFEALANDIEAVAKVSFDVGRAAQNLHKRADLLESLNDDKAAKSMDEDSGKDSYGGEG
jgi:uncharacterized protein YjbI with pentapeptide repeats